jgi:flagellar operon protein
MSAAVPTNPALNPGIGSVKPPAPAYAPGRPSSGSPPSSGPAFAEVLKEASGREPLHFSRHALERVQRRGIELDPSTLSRLNEGVGRAAGKGSRDSVVLVDGTAFVVSVGNRTVVTAVGAQHMREHVFTNIDSAVIA